MVIMKFGGSSVADTRKIRAVVDIVRERVKTEPVCLVFSAMKGITDYLIEAATMAEAGNGDYTDRLHRISTHTYTVIDELCGADCPLREEIQGMLEEIRDILHGIDLVRECSARSMDLIMSFGERISNMIITRFMNDSGLQAEYVDAREILLTDSNFGNASVQFDETYKKIKKQVTGIRGIPVITGFIASNSRGITTTLGRNGSDYTATLVGAALKAERVEIWTDVNGILSADPRYVPDAFVIPEISVEDAMEMSYFGAEVIHPFTLIPAVDSKIDIQIKNTLAPGEPGTRITRNTKDKKHPVTGIASIEGVALINIEGGGMLGMPGIASRVFHLLSDARVNIIMISQASSEHSICIVCREKEISRAESALRKGLEKELGSKKINNIDIRQDLEIVAIVGENMKGTPGISGRLFSALGEKKINVLAIAQGSSEHNISFVIQRKERELALRTVHTAFFA